MTKFTKSFLWRFILDIILLGIFVRFCQIIILTITSRFISTYSTPFLLIEAVVVSAISMLFICFLTYWNIGVISKKGCYDYPNDSDKWFRNFAIINIWQTMGWMSKHYIFHAILSLVGCRGARAYDNSIRRSGSNI